MTPIDLEFFADDDWTGEKRKVRIKIIDGLVFIQPEGHGVACSSEGEGFPIVVEWYNDKPRIHVWEDINSEDATHRITLENSSEIKRRHRP